MNLTFWIWPNLIQHGHLGTEPADTSFLSLASQIHRPCLENHLPLSIFLRYLYTLVNLMLKTTLGYGELGSVNR